MPSVDLLQDVKDRQELRDLMAHYFHAVDRHDWELMAKLFTPAATFDFNHGRITKDGAQQIIGFIRETRHPGGTYHFMGNQTAEITGDRAQVETYAIANNLHPVTAERPARHDSQGLRYLDEMVREKGRWVIKARRMLVDWERHDTLPGTPQG